MRKLYPGLLILSICWLLSCHSGSQPSVAAVPVRQDSVSFDLHAQSIFFQYRNALTCIPCLPSVYDSISEGHFLDSATMHSIYQDTISHLFMADVGGGSRLYGYIDTIAGYDVVCVWSARGDAGDIYDLVTLSKAGRRIDMLQVASLQGEEDTWNYNETAHLGRAHPADRGYSLQLCRQCADSL